MMATWGQTNQHNSFVYSWMCVCVRIKYVTFQHVIFFFQKRNCLAKDNGGWI
jgi:hypothetical protein